MSMRELTKAEIHTIYLSLLHLGVIHWTKSSKRMQLAMQYVVAREDLAGMPVIELYADIAKINHDKWQAVERSLRVSLDSIWKNHTQECSQLFFHSATPVKKPQMSQFLYLYKQEFENGNIQRWNESIATPLDFEAAETVEDDGEHDDDVLR